MFYNYARWIDYENVWKSYHARKTGTVFAVFVCVIASVLAYTRQFQVSRLSVYICSAFPRGPRAITVTFRRRAPNGRNTAFIPLTTRPNYCGCLTDEPACNYVLTHFLKQNNNHYQTLKEENCFFQQNTCVGDVTNLWKHYARQKFLRILSSLKNLK